MRVRRSRLLFQSKSVVGFYFGPEATKRVFKKLSFVHFTKNQGHQELVWSPRKWNISPKFRETDPKLVKITICARRSRLLFQSQSKVGLYFGPEAREWALKNFRCVHFTANQDKQELVESPRDWKTSPKFRQINPKFVKITMHVRRSPLLFQC